jgi:hypothetical protein
MFFDINNVFVAAILSITVSFMFFHFFLQFRGLSVNYEMLFNALPEFVTAIVKFVTNYIFEFGVAINIVISLQIPTVDAFFFFLLIETLFFFTLFFNYDIFRTNNIQMLWTFFIVVGRLSLRTPTFMDHGVVKIIRKALDLSFVGSSSARSG